MSRNVTGASPPPDRLAQRLAAWTAAPALAAALLAGCQNAPGAAGTSAPRADSDRSVPLNKDFGDCSRRRCDLGK
jgi:hypothetical protein